MLIRNPQRSLVTFSLLLLLIAGGIWALVGQPQAAEEQKVAERIDLCNRDALPTTRVKFKNPETYPAKEKGPDDKGGIVAVNLEMNFARYAIDRSLDRKIKDPVRLRTYNGVIVGPTIRVSPGDRLKIKFKNGIGRAEPDVPPSSKNPNAANGFNITNLHTHGLHVSPEGWSDNIFKEIGPSESAEFCYDIPADHPAGTFWYHPHRHGSTGVQTASGMAGMLVVDGGMDEVPEIKEAMRAGREKFLVFQQITYSISPNQVGEVLPADIYRPLTQRTIPLPDGGLRVANTAINGELLPDMVMAPGEIQRWRCLHGATNTSLNLAILDNKDQPLSLHELARDGFALPQITPQKNIILHPGYRSDFLVQAPPAPGEYFLVSSKLDARNSISDKDQVLEHLARVIVQGDPVNMKMPAPNSIKKYALPSIPDADLVKAPPRKLLFFKKIISPEKKILTVNGKMFNDDPPPEAIRVKLGTAEEWHLSSEGEGGHPFHIHVNPFEVIEKNPSDGIKRYFRDTIWVPLDPAKDNPVVVRMRFETFPGKTVLHCHSLDHEDQGMMRVVQIDGEAPPSRCDPKRQTGLPALPAKAPAWTLRDPAEKRHRLTDFADRDVLLVFFRGLACPHCRSQLEALAKRRKALAEAKLTVVAICPDSSEELRSTLKDDLPPDAIPFLLLSDPFHEAFRAYGCHDGRALHGTFLIDAEGMVRWQEVGDEPFMDIDRLLEESKRLKPKAKP